MRRSKSCNPGLQKVNVRVIAATNRNLHQQIEEGKFREDLFYRLNVFPVNTIPLRERPEDIEILSNFFLKKYSKMMRKEFDPISTNNLKKLQCYKWPGNIRELENLIQRYMITSEDKQLDLSDWNPKTRALTAVNTILDLEENERQHIKNVLLKTNGKVSGEGGAAEILKINPKTLMSRMTKLGIKRKLE